MMKAPLIAASIAILGFSVPAFADCGKSHPQALSASSTVVAQSSDTGSSPKSDEGNQQSSDDDDDN